MKKYQHSNRLSKQQKELQGPKGIFGKLAIQHDIDVKEVAKFVFEYLKHSFPNLEFRHRNSISKKEINSKLNKLDKRLGKTLFLQKASVKPDGGIIEVKDRKENWRIILISEAKFQGKDIENIKKGILVGKNKNQDTMPAGNAIERSHKNINEFRNFMLDEKHFPYVLFLEGSNFLTETLKIKRPDGRIVELRYDDGSLNRLDRITAANYSLPLNTNLCKNIFIKFENRKIMLQAVSIYTKTTKWNAKEMFEIMLDIALTSLVVLKLIPT